MSKRDLRRARARLASTTKQLDAARAAVAFGKLAALVVALGNGDDDMIRAQVAKLRGDSALVSDFEAVQRVLSQWASVNVQRDRRDAGRDTTNRARAKVTADALARTAAEPRQKARAAKIGVHPTTLARAKRKAATS